MIKKIIKIFSSKKIFYFSDWSELMFVSIAAPGAGETRQAGGAAGGGPKVAPVHLQEGRHRLQHPRQVSRPQECRGLRGLHQGEDQADPGEQAAH